MNKTTSNEILDAMWDDFDARVWKVCDFLHLKKYELADELDMQQQRLSRLKEGKHHKEAYLILLNHPEINARWLLFGQGNMVDEHPAPKPYDTDTAQPSPTASEPPATISARESALLDRITALAIENGMLKSRLGEKMPLGLASVS